MIKSQRHREGYTRSWPSGSFRSTGGERTEGKRIIQGRIKVGTMVETYIRLAKRKEYSNHTETFSQDFLEEVAFKLSLERQRGDRGGRRARQAEKPA